MANEPLDIDTLEMMLGVPGLANEKEALRLLFAEVRRLQAELATYQTVQTQVGGKCLICERKRARYCGMWCAQNPTTPDGAYQKYATCATCGDPHPLYCSPHCAVRGR